MDHNLYFQGKQKLNRTSVKMFFQKSRLQQTFKPTITNYHALSPIYIIFTSLHRPMLLAIYKSKSFSLHRHMSLAI